MLEGKTAIVTGASRGIGAAIAKKLASEGLNIAIVFAGNEKLAGEVCRQCLTFGVKAEKYCCDISDFSASKELICKVVKDFGTVDVLVNNAGITHDRLIPMMSEQDFDDVIATNLKGTFNMIRHCSAVFIKNRFGRIVNISSVSGLTGNAGQANYAASKAGVIGLTKTTARELASRDVTCNAIAPGLILTDMTKDLSGKNEELRKMIPLGFFGKPEDIADAVSFLIHSNYITGEVIRVDGGIGM